MQQNPRKLWLFISKITIGAMKFIWSWNYWHPSFLAALLAGSVNGLVKKLVSGLLVRSVWERVLSVWFLKAWTLRIPPELPLKSFWASVLLARELFPGTVKALMVWQQQLRCGSLLPWECPWVSHFILWAPAWPSSSSDLLDCLPHVFGRLFPKSASRISKTTF